MSTSTDSTSTSTTAPTVTRSFEGFGEAKRAAAAYELLFGIRPAIYAVGTWQDAGGNLIFFGDAGSDQIAAITGRAVIVADPDDTEGSEIRIHPARYHRVDVPQLRFAAPPRR